MGPHMRRFRVRRKEYIQKRKGACIKNKTGREMASEKHEEAQRQCRKKVRDSTQKYQKTKMEM